jgi:DNA uptake protein ComE-like DNA-binding protein
VRRNSSSLPFGNLSHPKSVRTSKITVAVSVLGLALLSGCTQQKESPEELREKTAQATAQLKDNAKAIAEGVREGWSRDKPLDINKAGKDDLLRLPGIDEEHAARIIAARPYDNADQLVTRHVLSPAQYDRIKDEVIATN